MKNLFLLICCLFSLGLFAQNTSINGTITMANFDGLDDVTVTLQDAGGNTLQQVVTDASGQYQFDGLTEGGTYTILPSRATSPLDGVSTFDIVIIARHILGTESITDPYRLLASDANDSNSVTTYDMVLLRLLILGITQDLPTSSGEWRFALPGAPAGNIAPYLTDGAAITTSSGTNTLDLIGVKLGDVNFTAL